MRKEKNGNRYFSFEELANNVFNIKIKNTQSWDEKKKNEIKEVFEKKHTCRSCNTPMTYKGGNIMCCMNPDCPKQNFHLLSEKGKRTAINLYKNDDSEVIA